MTLRILATPQLLAEALADVFVSEARRSIAARSSFAVALSGGTTPRSAYALLAQQPRRSSVDWPAVHIFFGDERCVPPDDPASNYKMASEAFLKSVPVLKENVHRIRAEEKPEQAAREYADRLIRSLGAAPVLDLVLLGMGADGHTASLFPGEDPNVDSASLVRAVYVAKLQTHRITMTPQAINAARRVVIAVEGLPKAPALYAVLRGPHDPVLHPVQIVSPRNSELTWLVDAAAASELSN